MPGAASAIEENLSRMDGCVHAITREFSSKMPDARAYEEGPWVTKSAASCLPGRPRVRRRARTLDASQPLVYDPGVVAVVNNLLVVEAEGVLWEHALREKSAAIAVIVVAAWKSGASKLWYSCGEFKKMLLNACCEGIRYGLAMVDLVAGACEIDDA